MLIPVYHVTCEGCGREFDWEPPSIGDAPPNYHSRTCRERKRRRLRDTVPTKCPHPWKQTYSSHRLAQDKCNEYADPYMKPYRCKCGGIHVGHVRFYIKDWKRK